MVRLAELAEDEPFEETTTWLEVELRGKGGEVYPGSRLRVRLPNQRIVDATLGEASCWRADALGQAGTCSVELVSLGEKMASAKDFAEVDGTICLEGKPVLLLTSRRHVLQVQIRPAFKRMRTETLRFAHDSVLLVPLAADRSPLPALATVAARAVAEPELRLLILGHASTPGAASHNTELSNFRAQGIAHFLKNDKGAWVDLAAEHGHPADVQRMLAYLAEAHDWPTAPGRSDGELDERSEQAVGAFQAAFNMFYEGDLHEDGKITRATLGALFDVFFEEFTLLCEAVGLDEPQDIIPRVESSYVLGAGTELAPHENLAESSLEDGQRRVDLALLPQELEWLPSQAPQELVDNASSALLDVDGRVSRPRELRVQIVDHYGQIVCNEPYRIVTDEEEREGVTDDEGILVESDLRGKHPFLVLGEGDIVVFDDAYFEQGERRRERPPEALVLDDGVKDTPNEEPLPATSDEEDVEIDEDDAPYDDDDDDDDPEMELSDEASLFP